MQFYIICIIIARVINFCFFFLKFLTVCHLFLSANQKEREQYECIIIGGKFFHKQSRNLVDTKGKWIFVLSPAKRLYAGQVRGHKLCRNN